MNTTKVATAQLARYVKNEQKLKDGFLAELSAPARRALEKAEIDSLEKLSTYTEEEILKLHGMGKASLPKLKSLLVDEELDFKR